MHINKDCILGVDLARLVKKSSSCEVGLTSFMVPAGGEQ